jgi:hypothetical protein
LALEYPNELLWNGRSIEPEFLPEELLYYRVKDFDVQGKVNVDEIHCPNMSVNRGKYSRPQHVLYARMPMFLHYKVAQFQVQEIPPDLTTGEGRTIDFRIEHDPTRKSDTTDENYAHSEIRAFDGVTRKKNISSQVVLKEYRMRLRRVMVAAPVPAELNPGS